MIHNIENKENRNFSNFGNNGTKGQDFYQRKNNSNRGQFKLRKLVSDHQIKPSLDNIKQVIYSS